MLNLKTFHAILYFFVLILTPFLSTSYGRSTKDKDIKKSLEVVGITQIVAHESLNKVYKGIIDVLKKEGFEDKKEIDIHFANAHGDMSTAVQIAEQFRAKNPKLIIAITTPSAQAVLNNIQGTSIPLIFATVTDPVGAKLVSSLQNPGKNVTGTRNVAPIRKQLQLLKSVLPELNTIGIVLNYSEDNSVQSLAMVQKEAKTLSIQVVTSATDNSSTVAESLAGIIHKVDAVFLLQDNTVASALPSLLHTAKMAKKPVFSTYVEAVRKGALMGLAYDEYYIGVQTGKIAVKVLKGTKASDIPVEDPHKLDLAINLKTAKDLGISIPASIKNRPDTIIY